MENVKELLERVKAATGPDRELDFAIERFALRHLPKVLDHWTSEQKHELVSRYTASVDACIALVEHELPGCGIVIDREPPAKGGAAAGAAVNGWIGEEGPEGRAWEHFDATGPTFPLAILGALLSALNTPTPPSPLIDRERENG